MNRRYWRVVAPAAAAIAMPAAGISIPAMAQDMDHSMMDHGHTEHGQGDHGQMDHGNTIDHYTEGSVLDDGTMILPAAPKRNRASIGSGTARIPGVEGSMNGLHVMTGDWMLMAHGYAWGVYTDQGGARGDDKAYVQSMLMATAERPLGDGARLTLKSMFSLEPLMSARGYPNLFATGETANGIALIDRQHPHDLFMELAARIDVDIAPGASAFLYGGPVGEPALGPSAFMMRRSSRYNAEAPITHHWFDSTHITYGVVTAGVSASAFQIEASAFRGREPDEERWGIETPKLDSWSVRGTWSPSSNWAAQLSYGRIKSPEALHDDEDEGRLTASVSYGDDRLSVIGAFSAKNRLPGPVLTAWLLEANWNPASGHNLFGRIENVENDELFPEGDPLHGAAFRVTKMQAGYAYRIPLGKMFGLALGGSAAIYDKPRALDAAYGKNPVGLTAFAKLSLGD
ncbi:hypothetical protein [Sphingobium phenoxybenzoativorans]|uniref:hypothetical protein n=1 Tax=Sphingobium phenoxybenzoativorans TaxID=1592790 RepID=UPI000A657B4E|nr:hypothetical protein [Sphingobium phenoxybenzoativorans]